MSTKWRPIFGLRADVFCSASLKREALDRGREINSGLAEKRRLTRAGRRLSAST